MVVSKRTAIANLKKETVVFLENNLDHFLEDNPGMEFYALAIDVNPLSGMLSLSLNTYFDFKKKLLQYRNQADDNRFDEPEAVEALRFTTSEWHYQAFASMCPLDETLYNHYFVNNYELYLETIAMILLDFKTTQQFSKIPKCSMFTVLCKSEDDTYLTSLQRMQKIERKKLNVNASS